LNVTTIVVSGTNLSDFVRAGITLPANIAAGATTTFTLTFTPSAAGTRDATVTVNNDDANEAVYDFAVRGTGLATIAITEWISNPGGNEATDEWVELYNFGASPVDIQNWKIEDEDADTDVITASSFVIPAGGYVIIAKNKAAFLTQWLGACSSADPNVIEVPGLTLANTSDEIIIRDVSTNIVWSVAYQSDDVSGIATQYTEAPTFTNRVWGSKAVPGVNRTGNDVTGTLGYQNNNTTADPNVMTSTTGDMGSPFNGIGIGFFFSEPTGTTNTWVGCIDDDWSNGANWSTGITPTTNDIVYVPANASNPLVINEVATCAKMIVQIGGVCKVDYNAGGKLVVKF